MLRFFLLITAVVYGVFTSGPVGAQAEPPERLLIISPAPGEVILGSTVKAIVEAPKGLPDGHVHLWLDTEPVHDSEHTIVLSNTQEHTFNQVFSGLHTLYAEWFSDDHAPSDNRLTAAVEFETTAEELKPAPKKEGSVEAPPDNEGGYFLPRGKGNTILVLLLVLVGIIILWMVYGRKR